MNYKIPVRGTCAHAYIMSFQNQILTDEFLIDNNKDMNLFKKALEIREEFKWTNTNIDELKAFCAFTKSYQEKSLLLVDTYNTLNSGVKNAIIVSIALNFFKKEKNIRGIRLDSGDLAFLSKESKNLFRKSAEISGNSGLRDLKVAASNDINEKSLRKFISDGHELDILGIGTNLVTCQLQPLMYIDCEIMDMNYEYDIVNVIDKEGYLRKRIVLQSPYNEKIDYNLEVNGKVENSMKLLFKEFEAFNEMDLGKSRNFAISNFRKIKHMIELYSNEIDENKMSHPFEE